VGKDYSFEEKKGAASVSSEGRVDQKEPAKVGLMKRREGSRNVSRLEFRYKSNSERREKVVAKGGKGGRRGGRKRESNIM